MTALVILLVCVSVFRLTMLVRTDTIAKPMRDRLAALEAGGIAALNAHRTPNVRQRVGAWLSEMLECAYCTSFWLGLLVALGWWRAVDAPAPVFFVPAVALTASAATGVATLVVGWLETLGDSG